MTQLPSPILVVGSPAHSGTVDGIVVAPGAGSVHDGDVRRSHVSVWTADGRFDPIVGTTVDVYEHLESVVRQTAPDGIALRQRWRLYERSDGSVDLEAILRTLARRTDTRLVVWTGRRGRRRTHDSAAYAAVLQ